MFCTTLRQRHDLLDLLPFLSSSVNPKLRECDLRTHDLALAYSFPAHSSPNQEHQQPHQTHPHSHSHSQSYKNQYHQHSDHPVAFQNHLFLILTHESTTPTELPDTLARITNFVAFATTSKVPILSPTPRPRPAVAFLLPASSTIPLHAYTILQTSIYSLSLPFSSTLLLPIPSPKSLLPLLLSYLTQQQQSPPPSPPAPVCTPPRSFLLLRHATITAPARLLPEHPAHVLSDLYPSLSALAVATSTEAGKERLREWIGGDEAEGVIAFWEGERIVGR